MGRDKIGEMEQGDSNLISVAVSLARLTGNVAELSDAFAQRYVLADPPRLAREAMTPAQAAEGCAEASPAIATACHKRLRALLAEGWFTDGHPALSDTAFTIAERFAAHDMEGAAAAYRPMLANVSPNGYAARAFDAIGDPDSASRIDAASMKWVALYHGATFGHVREAHRMVARKDFAAARALAQTVIDAWGTADVKVPAVAEMRALIAALPAAREHPP